MCACVCVSILRCVRITDTGLGYLSTMSSLRSLYLRWCCQVHWALNLPLLHIRRPYSHLSIHFTLSPLQSVCQSIYLSICLSVCLSVCLFVCVYACHIQCIHRHLMSQMSYAVMHAIMPQRSYAVKCFIVQHINTLHWGIRFSTTYYTGG